MSADEKYASGEAVAFATLVELLRWRAQRQSDQIAYTFLSEGDGKEFHLTYGELDRRARGIAAGLQSITARGDFVLLLYNPGLEFITAFLGCLYAGVVAVPLYPPHPVRPQITLPRIEAAAIHARAVAVLTTASIKRVAEPLLQQASLQWLASDELTDDLTALWFEPKPNPDSLAYIQYTSGATASPKGVMLSHGNLLHNSALIYRHFGHTPESQGVIWLPPYHDMGLIGGILQPLFGGFPVTLMSPTSFLMRPLRWLQTISSTRATTSGGPNFAYDLCAQKITSEQRETLDLSSWDVAFCGAEAIRHDTLERFAETFAPCGFRRESFYPCYGLAEASLFVTGHLRSPDNSCRKMDLTQKLVNAPLADGNGVRRLVSCGSASVDQTVIVVHPESCTLCSPGETGEIWVASASVAHGYLHRPDETEHTFKAYLADSGEGPFLRTGDLGFFRGGELYITGRLKDIIIIGGRNYYPEDIEQTAKRSHSTLAHGECVAFSIDGSSQELLVILAEVNRHHYAVHVRNELEAVRHKIIAAVAEFHNLRVDRAVLLKPFSLPRTPSGKIQRHACRKSFLTDTLNVLERTSQREVV
jgi:acyl-CoA synthetase (AMP-forming)/AMP-acid ligase II